VDLFFFLSFHFLYNCLAQDPLPIESIFLQYAEIKLTTGIVKKQNVMYRVLAFENSLLSIVL